MTGPSAAPVATQEILRAYRACLDPTPRQRELFARHCGAVRRTYNWALVEKEVAWKRQQQEAASLTYSTFGGLSPEQAWQKAKVAARKSHPVPGYTQLSARFTAERGACDPVTDEVVVPGVFPWHAELSRRAPICGLRQADQAWKNYFDSLSGRGAGRKVGRPRPKKLGRCRDAYTIPAEVKKLDDSRHITIPRVGRVRLHSNLRRLLKKLNRGVAKINSVTIVREGDRWFASVLVAETVPAPQMTRRQKQRRSVGVDLGVNRAATLSDGTGVANPRHYRHAKKQLTDAQRALSRTKKGSQNRKKAARRVGRLQARLAERRKQFLHQITKTLATQYAVIGVEDLDVAAMTRSARGTIEHPGTHVRQKAGLNREILDVGFGEFVRQLAYKTTWYGSQLQTVDRWYPSSKLCSQCGQTKTDLGRGDRTYHCDRCGLIIDRDLNAAANIAAAASRLAEAAKATLPSETVNSITPTTCDKRGPEAKIGRPEESMPLPRQTPTMTQEDPRGHPDRAISRRPSPPPGGTRKVKLHQDMAGHSP